VSGTFIEYSRATELYFCRVRLLGGSVSSTYLRSIREIFSRDNEWKVFAQYQLLAGTMADTF
jgi:hypothetical protein